MSDFESQLRNQLRTLSELRPRPADLSSRIDERIDGRRLRRSTPRTVMVGAMVLGIAVLAGALIARTEESSVHTVDPAQQTAGDVDPSEIVSAPGSRLLPGTDIPWAERVAVRACSTVLPRLGLSTTRQDELVSALASRGQAICSFETPDILSVNPDDLVIDRVDTTDLYVHIVWIPAGLDPEVDSLDNILTAGGAFLSLNVRRPNDSDPRSTPDPHNPRGGWLIYDGGVPMSQSVLSHPEADRFELSWYETPVAGPRLRVSLFIDTDVNTMLNDLSVHQVASGDDAPSTTTSPSGDEREVLRTRAEAQPEDYQPPSEPTLSVAPSSGLVDGQIIAVLGEGLPPGEEIAIAACRPLDPAATTDPPCLYTSSGTGTVDDQGRLWFPDYTLAAYEPAIGFDCDEPPGCELAWYVGIGEQPRVTAPISVTN